MECYQAEAAQGASNSGKTWERAQVPFHLTGSVLERKAGFPLTNAPKPWYFASESSPKVLCEHR